MPVEDLIARIENEDAEVRCAAWQEAGEIGAAAVGPLAAVMGGAGGEAEVARAAKHGLWAIVRRASRGGADARRKSAVAELIRLLDDGQPAPVRREVLWMLSEIGGDEAVAPIAKLLASPQLREDARCALERIPGQKSLGALKQALAAAPEDFKAHIAQSLRARGETVEDVPCRKLDPVYKTTLESAQ